MVSLSRFRERGFVGMRSPRPASEPASFDRTVPMRWLAVLLLLPCLAHAQLAHAQGAPGASGAPPEPNAPAKAALCAGCHGAKGVPVNASFPVIAGQTEGYLYLQLRDYKLGNRKNVIMQAVAARLEKQDMKDLAAYFAAQSWPNLHQQAAPAEAAHRAMAAADSAVCTSCHLDGYVGDSAVPRMAGQGADYLRGTMAAFRSGARANNPWMSALLKTYSDEDIDALAKYLAGL